MWSKSLIPTALHGGYEIFCLDLKKNCETILAINRKLKGIDLEAAQILTTEEILQVKQACHKIAGAAGLYNISELSQVAEKVDRFLLDRKSLSETDQSKLLTGLDRLLSLAGEHFS